MSKFEVEIIDYGYNGEGVGKHNGKTCFVPCTIVGERVLVSTIKDNSKFCHCKAEKVLTPSADRQKPPCPYFGECGGCAYQHISYEKELEIKKGLLQRQLAKAGYSGKITVHKSPDEYFYRNKIKLFCHGDKLSLIKTLSSQRVPIERCLIAKEEINEAMHKVQTFVEAKHLGQIVQNVIIRAQGENLLVHFILKRRAEIDYRGLQIMLGARCGIYQTADGVLRHISGIKTLSAKEFGLNCEFDVEAFHQVNDSVGEQLYNFVKENVSGANIINAYSGAGVLSAILSQNNRRVYGVEMGRAEHNSAQRLKEANSLSKMLNICGDCEAVLPDLLQSQFDCVVLDPPRAGVSKKVCEVLDASSVKQIIYISCDSASLTRDLTRLESYAIKSVHLFDMFARTGSYESVCILSKR